MSRTRGDRHTGRTRAPARWRTPGHPEESFGGALAGQERLVGLIHVAGNQPGAIGIGAGHEHRRHIQHIRRQPGSNECPDKLSGRQQHLSAQVTAFLFR